MASAATGPDLATAAWRTWGSRGLARRMAYEARKRSGRLRAAEAAWPEAPVDARLLRVGFGDQVRGQVGRWPVPEGEAPLVLFGAVAVDGHRPPDWHTHPGTGHRLDPDAHWSTLSDHDPDHGDIKDLWELSRLGWLHRDLRRWAATGDDAVADGIWSVLEDWYRRNPRYLGPNWMCGQESSLRTIAAITVADALDASPATTDDRRALAAAMVHDAVGRVSPTLGYALSQRNNHATSEAGFLWGASVLAPWLPDADRLGARAGAALTEAVSDQFGPDGAYAQHSPTYQRVALHVLLWCAAIARATGRPLPAGVDDAIARSVVHLGTLLVPESGGRMPNLGGNDGALVFDLADGGVLDHRPLLAHAAAVIGQDDGLGAGPWDEEAAWFGLAPRGERAAGQPVVVAPARATHGLRRGTAHAVLRAGALAHRPAHADQLHVDVWLDGVPVAIDPGSYRYTAPAPWGNALAGEEVHNLPVRPGAPQAVRSGRFFWRSWREAELLERVERPEVVAQSVRLVLADGSVLHRTVLVASGLVVVADRASAEVAVRWNLPADTEVVVADGPVRLAGAGWWAAIAAGGAVARPVPVDADPTSGWHAPTYGERLPIRAVVVGSGDPAEVITAFSTAGPPGAVLEAARGLLADRLDAGAVDAVLLAAGHQ